MKTAFLRKRKREDEQDVSNKQPRLMLKPVGISRDAWAYILQFYPNASIQECLQLTLINKELHQIITSAGSLFWKYRTCIIDA
ncbi:hypothetical protein OFB94_28795, partial [Escherichia coli]|nr:hypothetical protein [Escherichia coli]